MTAIVVKPEAEPESQDAPVTEAPVPAEAETAPQATTETPEEPAAAPAPLFRLYFLRHAPAGSAEDWEGPDDQRPLTEKGRNLVRKERKGLRELVGTPDAILTSPHARCVETAELLVKGLRFEGDLEHEPNLVPGGEPTALATILQTHAGKRDLVLVGHNPDLERWIAQLTTGAPEPFLELRKGGACRVDVDTLTPEPRGVLRWVLTPEQVRKLG